MTNPVDASPVGALAAQLQCGPARDDLELARDAMDAAAALLLSQQARVQQLESDLGSAIALYGETKADLTAARQANEALRSANASLVVQLRDAKVRSGDLFLC